MANIADTEYRFYGSEETLNAIYNAFNDHKEWLLYEVLENLGIDTKNLYVKGEVGGYCFETKNNKRYLYATCFTAYDELPEFINALRERFKDDKDFRIEYRCEESGCDYFVSNVKDAFFGEYYLDMFSEIESFHTFEEMSSYIKRNLAGQKPSLKVEDDVFTSFEKLQEWCEKYNEEHEDEYDEYIHPAKFEIRND